LHLKEWKRSLQRRNQLREEMALTFSGNPARLGRRNVLGGGWTKAAIAGRTHGQSFGQGSWWGVRLDSVVLCSTLKGFADSSLARVSLVRCPGSVCGASSYFTDLYFYDDLHARSRQSTSLFPSIAIQPDIPSDKKVRTYRALQNKSN
jgi:hypothetical protein